MKSCRNCTHSELRLIPEHIPANKSRTGYEYDIYGLCHKNGKEYPIYVADAKCTDWKEGEVNERN
jgi:hypothetical protein